MGSSSSFGNSSSCSSGDGGGGGGGARGRLLFEIDVRGRWKTQSVGTRYSEKPTAEIDCFFFRGGLFFPQALATCNDVGFQCGGKLA